MKTILFTLSIFILTCNDSLGYSESVIVIDSTIKSLPKEPVNTQNSTTVSKPKQEQVNPIAVIGSIAGLLSLSVLFLTAASAFYVGLVLAVAAFVLGSIGKAQIDMGRGKGRGWAYLAKSLGGILPFLYCFVWAVRALFGIK